MEAKTTKEIVVRKTAPLINISAARKAIEQAKTVGELKGIRDVAEMARQYAKKIGLHLTEQNMIAEIKIRAERKAGKILKGMEKAKGGQPYQKGSTSDIMSPVETLEGLGITNKQSSRWQLENKVPEKDFGEFVEIVKELEQELTSASTRRLALKYIPRPETPPLPPGKFSVIYADPPWKYSDQQDTPKLGGAEKHYPLMTIGQLCDMPVDERAADDAVLFLWVTSPMLEVCFAVINAWGFEYKTSFVWDKVKHNMGHYNSVRHEFLLICTRGSYTPQNKKLFDSVQSIERSGKHSEKPEEFRRIIETLYPKGEKLELFARTKKHGWTSYGNELEEL